MRLPRMHEEEVELFDKIPSSLEVVGLYENTDFDWIVEKLIPEGAITLLYGKAGTGKTWLVLQLGIAVSGGRPFCTLRTKKCPVIYVGFEDPLQVISKRLKIMGASNNFRIWHIDSDFPPPKLDKQWQKYKQLPAGSLLIFDTLRASQGGDENSSQDMAQIMEKLKELRKEGLTIVLVHHTPKASESIYKGSTAILDLVDHELCLEKLKDEDNENIETEVYRLGTKQKTRFQPGEVFLSFAQEGFELAQDPRVQKLYELCEIIKQKGEPLQQDIIKEAGEQLGWSKNKTLQVLKKGEGTFWRRKKGQGHKFYYVLSEKVFSNFPDIYSIGKLENTPHKTGKYQEKTLTSPEFSNFPEGSGKIGRYSGKYPYRDKDSEFEYDL